MSQEGPITTENEKHIVNGDIKDDKEDQTGTEEHVKPANEQASSQASTTTSSTSKTIYMYRNGDLFYPGKRLVVTKRAIKTWDSFLDDVTVNMQSRSGAIRDIRTPMHGTRVRSLEDLTHNSRYVAVSKGEKFRLIDYDKAVDVNQRKNQKPTRLKPIPRLDYRRDESPKAIENRLSQRNTKSMIIHIYRNGDPFTRAINIVLRPMEQKHMSVVVRAIEERVCLPSNLPIRRVYNMSGEKIKFANDIEDGQFYVVGSNEEFHDIKYGQYLPVLRGGGKINSSYKQVKYLNQPRSSKKQQNLSKSMDAENDEKSPEQTNRSNSQGRSPGRKQEKEEVQQKRHEKSKSKPEKTQNKVSNQPAERKKASEMTEQEKAALQIQSSYRAYNYRKKIQEGKTPEEIKQEETEKEKENQKVKEQKPQQAKPSPRQSKPPPKRNNAPAKQETPRKQEQPPKKEEPKKENPKKKEKPNQNNESDNEEKEKAAVKIQAGFRGYQARKASPEEKSKPKETPIKEAEKEKPQKTEEAKVEDQKQEADESKPKEEHKDNQDDNDQREASAVKIQAGYRGFKARNNMKLREESAKKIQAACRGYLTRSQWKERNEAATRIQASFHGFQTRKSNKERAEAASRIQAGFRGHQTRKENEEKSSAAAKIQAGFRGNKVRREMNQKKPVMLSPEEQVTQRQQAATKIQASFRGHAYRTKQQEGKPEDGKQR